MDAKNNSTLKDRIYTAVLNNIIYGKYQPEQLITEKGLMKEFDVSRAPVREALVELCKEKVLQSIPCYGYKVIPLTDEDIKSIQEYRIILECEYMRHFGHRITAANLDELQALLSSAADPGEKIDGFSHWDRNTAFHLMLMSFYKNDHAYKSLASALTIQKRAYAQDRWERWHSEAFSDPADLHHLILEQLRSNDLATAVRLLQADINSFVE